MATLRRVVITGLGLVSPIGLGVPAFRESLAAGRSGVHSLRLFDPRELPIRFGGEIEEFDAKAYVDRKDRKQLKIMARTAQLAVAAARLALDDASLPAGSVDPARLGVSMGTGVVPGDLSELGRPGRLCLDEASEQIDLRKWGREGLALIPPTWMLNHVPNMPACHVAILNDAQGPNNTLTQFDAAALFALLEARRVILRDSADVMLAGGADTRTSSCAIVRWLRYERLSRRNERPEEAVRPFGRGRDGEAAAEGAGVMVLEEAECARRRGARVLGEVVGGGSAFDRGRSGKGLARAMRAAMDEAGVGPSDLDHVNAAAGGTVEEDAWEARALAEALNGEPVPVLAMKSYLGNAGNGASVLELAASVLALNDGTLPMTLNHEQSDPNCQVHVTREPRPTTRPYVLKVAYTDQGQCAAAVVRVPAG
jgi:3-oxoacyl-[acyl-carrier-protein] synthase II